MKESINSNDVADATHSRNTDIKNILRKYTAQSGEKLYKAAAACDDRLEIFRQDVCEMVSEVIIFGELIARRAHQGIFRTRSHRKTFGRIAVDRKFEDHAERVFDRMREGCFGNTLESFDSFRRKTTVLLDNISLRMHRAVKRVEAIIDAVIERFMENRKRWTVSIATMAGCFMIFCVTVNAGTVYNYYYHGTEMGTVKDKTEVEAAAEQIKETVSEELSADVSVNAEPDVDITYEKEFSFSAVVDSAEEVADKLVSSNELEGNGYAITVNGETVALVDTEETADRIIDTVKENYCTASEDSIDADSDEAVSADEEVTGEVASEDAEADSAEVARNIILADSINSSTGVVGSEPANATDTGVLDATASQDKEDLISDDGTVTEGITIDNVIIEDEVSIEPVTSKISDFMDYADAIELFVDDDGNSKIFNISTVELEVYEEPIAYATTYEETDSLYLGEYEVKTTGVDGVMQVTAKVTKENGEEVARDVVQQTVEVPAVDEVILQGTNEKPYWYATGTFIQPASGRLSSNFGRRWGRQHQGIDIAGSHGSDIVAADGGTVIYAGYNSSGYGNLVKIDHGNGYVTYYGHNSSLCVSVGDKVAQGQVIAKMGSTGRSTGNHCHFEVRLNGTPMNPVNYLS